jgi:hypothetical protein
MSKADGVESGGIFKTERKLSVTRSVRLGSIDTSLTASAQTERGHDDLPPFHRCRIPARPPTVGIVRLVLKLTFIIVAFFTAGNPAHAVLDVEFRALRPRPLPRPDGTDISLTKLQGPRAEICGAEPTRLASLVHLGYGAKANGER